MSGWSDLVEAGLRVVPFDGTPPPRGNRSALFSATFTMTTRLLRRELDMLNAESLVVELDVRERDIRLDGFPRADARPVSSPAVRVTFLSKHGPVRMETAEFDTWQDNLRAIALSLEALRAVDRYGVSKRGEQYRGWKQLMPGEGDPTDAITTAELAWEVINREAGITWANVEPATSPAARDAAIRQALRNAHPDTGGSADRLRMVQKAREVIGAK